MKKLVLLLLIVGGIFWIASRPDTATTQAAKTTVVPPPIDVHVEGRRRAHELLTIKNFSWSKSGFGTVMQASFTFDNKSHYDLKDVVVRCSLSAPSGTTIDSSTKTVYERIPARSQKAIKDFNMGFVHSQATRAGCDVIAAQAGDYSAPPSKPVPKTVGQNTPTNTRQ